MMKNLVTGITAASIAVLNACDPAGEMNYLRRKSRPSFSKGCSWKPKETMNNGE